VLGWAAGLALVRVQEQVRVQGQAQVWVWERAPALGRAVVPVEPGVVR